MFQGIDQRCAFVGHTPSRSPGGGTVFLSLGLDYEALCQWVCGLCGLRGRLSLSACLSEPASMPMQLAGSQAEPEACDAILSQSGQSLVSESAAVSQWSQSGTSVTSVSETDLDMVARHYELRDSAVIERVLADSPSLVGLLVEVREKLPHFFPEATFAVELYVEPEIQSSEQVVVLICTGLDPETAFDVLRSFDDSWWLDNMERGQGRICVSLEFT